MDGSILISIIAATVSIIALLVSWFSYVDNHKHKRLYDTIDILKGWNQESLRQARAKITQLNDFHDVVIPKAIPLKQIEKQRKKDFENSQSITITDHINTILNYMNTIAIGIKVGIYNEEMIKKDLEQSMERIYFALEEYRDELTSPNNRLQDPWSELTKLLKRWNKKPSEDRKYRPPGGI